MKGKEFKVFIREAPLHCGSKNVHTHEYHIRPKNGVLWLALPQTIKLKRLPKLTSEKDWNGKTEKKLDINNKKKMRFKNPS